MRIASCIVLAFAAASALAADEAPAGKESVIAVTREACTTLAAYTPGVDAYGRPVAPADVDNAVTVNAPVIPIEIRFPDIERRNWKTLTRVAIAELDLATGEVRVNGRRITDVSESDVATACANRDEHD